MAMFGGLLILALVCAFSVSLAAAAGYDAACLPLPVLSGAAVLLFAAGVAGQLRLGGWLVLALLLVLTLLLAPKGGKEGWKQALHSPGLLLFGAAGAFLWLLFAVQQPMFTQWDEFTAWGLAPKMLKELGIFYAAKPMNLAAYKTYPATSLISYFFQILSPTFSEWQCLAALDILAFACVAAATAQPPKNRPYSVLIFGCGVLLPFFFSTVPVGTLNTIYANAMADLPLAMVFGGTLTLYHTVREKRGGLFLVMLPLALLAMIKDIAFAYGMIAVFLIGIDRLFGRDYPAGTSKIKMLGSSFAFAVPLVVPVLAAFLGWSRYTTLVDPAETTASVGSEGLSYGAVLLGGLRQLVGIGREEKFGQIMSAMGQAFFHRRVCLLGSSAVALAVITMVAAAAWLASEKGTPRRRVLCGWLAFAFCYGALYLFHLILYHYNFADLEGLALKDYERYLSPYYQGWFMAMLCLLGRALAERRRTPKLGSLALLGCTGAIVAVFLWRGIPTAGFWTNADSVYTVRADVKRRAAVANQVMGVDDRVLVMSQGDDCTRWYYYKYELTAKVIHGYGGVWWGDDDYSSRWPSDFMNLVETFNWGRYQYDVVGNVNSIMSYLEEFGGEYLLIDRSDAYLEAIDFSCKFEGGLPATMPATLYHYNGRDAEYPFTPVAQLESEVQG